MDLRVKNLFVCVLLMMFLSGCGNENVKTGPGPDSNVNKQTEAPADADPQNILPEDATAEDSEEPEKGPDEELTNQPETTPTEDDGEPVSETVVEDEEPLPDAVLGLKERADEGEALAQFKLASLYESGREGVSKNLPKAAALYRKAAEQGRADAQYNLGMMYESGHGVGKDPAEAARWFKTYNENQQKN
jgi:TPR repeat protein